MKNVLFYFADDSKKKYLLCIKIDKRVLNPLLDSCYVHNPRYT